MKSKEDEMSKETSLSQTAIVPIQGPPHTPGSLQDDRPERRLRQFTAWLILYLLLQAELGLAWDRNWHDYIGRDQFWIPPHIMIYTGLGAAGLVALLVVLVDSVRYIQQKPGVNERSTITVFRIFHAPLGFTIIGFGALIDLAAAPLDNYWHELYGIDVTLWAPFHIMGTIGGLLAGLGLLYAFASEAAIERAGKPATRRFWELNRSEWGMLIIFAAITEIGLPTLTAFQTFALGPWQLVSYPLPLVLASGFCLIGAVQCTHKSGAATLTVLLLWLLAGITQTFVPWALRLSIAWLGLAFRLDRPTPFFNTTLVLLPILFFINALIVDGVAFWNSRQHNTDGKILRWSSLLGALMGIPVLVVPPGIVFALLYLVPQMPLQTDVKHIFVDTISRSNLLLVLPLTLAFGAVIAWWAAALGDIWYWSQR